MTRSGLPVAMAVAGTGNGLFAVPFFTTVLAGVRPQEAGSASGLLNAVQQLGSTFGSTFGIALLGAVFLQGGRRGRSARPWSWPSAQSRPRT